jgi:hypothetical protein
VTNMSFICVSSANFRLTDSQQNTERMVVGLFGLHRPARGSSRIRQCTRGFHCRSDLAVQLSLPTTKTFFGLIEMIATGFAASR